MEPETKNTYVKIRIAKAEEDLTTARYNLEGGHWRAAINRAYYAIFHVASAALLWLDIERRKHSGVQAGFHEFLIKPGLIEVEYGRVYRDAREWREEQDYKDLAMPLDEAKVAQIVSDAERFVARLEQYLRQVGAIE